MIKKSKLEKGIRKEWKHIIFNLVFAGLTLLFAALFFQNILLATILIGLVSIIGLIKWKSKLTFIIFLFAGLWGPVSEMIAVYFGAWQYAVPTLLDIPLWLFLVWGNAGAFIYQIALEIKKLGVKK